MSKPSNIKETSFYYEGSGVLSAAIEKISPYTPESVSRYLLEKRLNLPEAQDKDLKAFVMMRSDKNDIISFSFFDTNFVLKNITQEDGSTTSIFNPASGLVAEFDISIANAVGGRDWRYYLDCKRNMGTDVKTPSELIDDDKIFENFHRYLANKLREKLNEQGLVDIGGDDGPDHISFEHRLLGLFLQYRELAKNPEKIMRVLRLG